MEEQLSFDFNEILEQYKRGKRLTGKDGLLAPLIKQLTEAALEAEVESHIANDILSGKSNRRNGFNKKTIKGTSDGSFELETPRDRNGTFEPQIVKKHQTTISDEIEEKILSMYGLGMSYTELGIKVNEKTTKNTDDTEKDNDTPKENKKDNRKKTYGWHIVTGKQIGRAHV